MLTRQTLRALIAESNTLDGRTLLPRRQEIDAYVSFLSLENPTIQDLERFAAVVAPGARVRRFVGQNIPEGMNSMHIPPFGGSQIEPVLTRILGELRVRKPFETHRAYWRLYPFTTGNGVISRALWLWQMTLAGNDLHKVIRSGITNVLYHQSLAEEVGGSDVAVGGIATGVPAIDRLGPVEWHPAPDDIKVQFCCPLDEPTRIVGMRLSGLLLLGLQKETT